jgi:undecaprenyl-diphosphatase
MLAIFSHSFAQNAHLDQTLDQTQSASWWRDFKTTWQYSWQGSYRQFESSYSWGLIAAGVPAHWYAFEHDDEITAKNGVENESTYYDFLNAMGTITYLPLIQGTFYYYGKKNQNQKARQFAMESLATMIQVSLETVVISYIPIHRRPSEENLSFFETSFRGNSSYPSGHIMPALALGFKAWQIYGPWYSLLPFVFAAAQGYERVQSKKHYFSDVVGSVILTGMASEGVRLAALNNDSKSVKNDQSWNYQFLVFNQIYSATVGIPF